MTEEIGGIMVYKLSVFINDLAFSNKLIIKVYRLLNEKAIKDIWLKKSIQRGHHLELFSFEREHLKIMEEFIVGELEEYSPVDISERKLKKQIRSVANAENVEANIDIQLDGTVLLEEVEEQDSQKVRLNSFETELAVEKKKMELILYLEGLGFFRENENQQNILLTKLFMNLGLLFNNNLKMGYLSMKSNILFFNLQLEKMKSKMSLEKYKQYYRLVNFLDVIEQNFINEGIENFLIENESSFFKYFVEDLYQFFTDELEKGNLYYKNLSDAESFVQKSKENGQITDFHKQFFTNQNFLSHHSSLPFVIYRYTVDVLYQVMPLLNVNPLRKQKITKMVSDKVETGYDMTWEDSYATMQKIFNKKVQ